ncbi:MAG: succinate--CoA ligase subunit beta, partial [Planctomycetota bacterium]
MKIHEYQAKELFRQYGVAVPQGKVVDSPTAAAEAFVELGGEAAVVKAQIHAGGRGKGTFREVPDQHGVQLVRNDAEAEEAASQMLGNTLVTIQTGEKGRVVNRLLIEEGCRIERELYLGIVVDRARGCPVFIASQEGGMEIEKVAAENPEAIIQEPFSVFVGLRPYQARKLAWKLGLTGDAAKAAVKFMTALAKLFLEKDCSLVE